MTAPAETATGYEEIELLAGAPVTTLEPLGSEHAGTFRVGLADGRSAVAKFTVAEDRPATKFQLRILDFLGSDVATLPLPRVIGTGLIPCGDGRDLHLLTWLPGTVAGTVTTLSPDFHHDLGATAAGLTSALAGFPTAGAPATHDWDMRSAATRLRQLLGAAPGDAERAVAERVIAVADADRAALGALRTQVIHGDLNDFNLLVGLSSDGRQRVCGVLDVGDALVSPAVVELGVAAGYALVGPDPLGAVLALVGGWTSVKPLTVEEVSLLWPLALQRLAMNALTWTRRLSTRTAKDPAYAHARSSRSWPALLRAAALDPGHCTTALLAAAGVQPTRPRAAHAGAQAPVIATGIETTALDAGDVDADTPPGCVGVRRHLDGHPMRAARLSSPPAATLATGARLVLPAGTGVFTPTDVTVVAADRDGVTLRHGRAVSRWSGLTVRAAVGDSLAAGDLLGAALTPHTELTVIVADDLATLAAAPPAVPLRERELWSGRLPDPADVFVGWPRPRRAPAADQLRSLRKTRLASSQRAYYRTPPLLVSGRGVWLRDSAGGEYLDAFNNVTSVGHCHPRVVEALRRQAGRLNTNSRLSYAGIATFAERIAATLPDPLEVVLFTCTGSEANDLAMRIARQVTGRDHIAVLDGAYHGNTTAVTGISPNRYAGAGGSGRPTTTIELPTPDRYRGILRDEAASGTGYAALAREALDAGDGPMAGVFAESLMGTAGHIVLPEGYLAELFLETRARGGLCVSDEVQVGLGRLGETFWGFETHGVVPDIVTIGKPLGNGHPVAAVVTTREIADAFDNGMKYFNTFAGNPVSCAVGSAVIDVIEDEELQANCLDTGGYLKGALQELAARHPLIGDVRGTGLYLGVDLVADRVSREGAAAQALSVCELLLADGILSYPTGRTESVLKIKPPMVFAREHADLLVCSLDAALTAVEL